MDDVFSLWTMPNECSASFELKLREWVWCCWPEVPRITSKDKQGCTDLFWRTCPSTSDRCTARTDGRRSGGRHASTSPASAFTRSTPRTSYPGLPKKPYRWVDNFLQSLKTKGETYIVCTFKVLFPKCSLLQFSVPG